MIKWIKQDDKMNKADDKMGKKLENPPPFQPQTTLHLI